MNQITKRIIIYLFGLFLLGFGVSFSIKADFGVSPVSSLGYAIALITGISVGIATFLSNVVYIGMQIILTKKVEWKSYGIQLFVMVFLSAFIDLTLWIVNFLPDPTNIWMRLFYLVISLVIIAISVFFYLNSRLPVMPYDTLVPIMSKKFGMPFGKAKMIGDMSNVVLSLIVCLVFLQSFGSIGIGTFIAAYAIGKILGVFMRYFKQPLMNWVGEIER